jgi:hypothetical protein
MEEKDFLFPVVEGWQWSKEDVGSVRKLSCGTEISLVVPPDISEGRDPSAYRMAYDPSEIEGPEAFEWAEKFKVRDAARCEETLRHLKTVKRRTAHEAARKKILCGAELPKTKTPLRVGSASAAWCTACWNGRGGRKRKSTARRNGLLLSVYRFPGRKKLSKRWNLWIRPTWEKGFIQPVRFFASFP